MAHTLGQQLNSRNRRKVFKSKLDDAIQNRGPSY